MKVRVVLEIDTERDEFRPESAYETAMQVRKMIENNSDWSAFELEATEIGELTGE